VGAGSGTSGRPRRRPPLLHSGRDEPPHPPHLDHRQQIPRRSMEIHQARRRQGPRIAPL